MKVLPALTARFNSKAHNSRLVLSLVVSTVTSHNICHCVNDDRHIKQWASHTPVQFWEAAVRILHPSHTHYIWIHPFLHQGLGPATVPPPLLIFSSFLPLSLEGIPGEAPIAFLPSGIQASLHPLSVTTMVHRNYKTQVLSSRKFCHSSWFSQVAGFTRVSEKDMWASQAGNYRMTSPC